MEKRTLWICSLKKFFFSYAETPKNYAVIIKQKSFSFSGTSVSKTSHFTPPPYFEILNTPL